MFFFSYTFSQSTHFIKYLYILAPSSAGNCLNVIQVEILILFLLSSNSHKEAGHVKVFPLNNDCTKELYTLRQISFFHSSIEHHYIFITRCRMTEMERESEGERKRWTSQQHRNTAGVSLTDIWLHCLNLTFICCRQNSQLYKSCKWTFDLTIWFTQFDCHIRSAPNIQLWSSPSSESWTSVLGRCRKELQGKANHSEGLTSAGN